MDDDQKKKQMQAIIEQADLELNDTISLEDQPLQELTVAEPDTSNTLDKIALVDETAPELIEDSVAPLRFSLTGYLRGFFEEKPAVARPEGAPLLLAELPRDEALEKAREIVDNTTDPTLRRIAQTALNDLYHKHARHREATSFGGFVMQVMDLAIFGVQKSDVRILDYADPDGGLTEEGYTRFKEDKEAGLLWEPVIPDEDPIQKRLDELDDPEQGLRKTVTVGEDGIEKIVIERIASDVSPQEVIRPGDTPNVTKTGTVEIIK